MRLQITLDNRQLAVLAVFAVTLAGMAYVFAQVPTGTQSHPWSQITCSGCIANAHISSSAAIAGTKISPNFGSQNIITSGNVGIGVTPTLGKLQISGVSTTAIYAIASDRAIYAMSTDGSAAIYGDGASGGAGVYGRSYDDGAGIYGEGYAGGYAGVFMGGNVGIGTASPGYTLDVNGDARVNGQMRVTGQIYGWNVPTNIRGTTSSHNGDWAAATGDGYYAMNQWIQTNGCSGYHVCDAVEITRYMQVNGSVYNTIPGNTYWINTGLLLAEFAGPTSDDCSNWQTASSSYRGPTWSTYGGTWGPSYYSCNENHPVLCCR